MHVIQQYKVSHQKQLVRIESGCFKGEETGHREQRGNKTWLFMSLTVLFYFLDYVQVLIGGGSMMKIQGSPVSLNPIEKSQDLTDGGFWQEKKGKRKLVVKMPSFKKKKNAFFDTGFPFFSFRVQIRI